MSRDVIDVIRVYFHEAGLTSKEYCIYMDKHYPKINLREPMNQLGPVLDKQRARQIKRLLKSNWDDTYRTLYRSLQRYKIKTLANRRGPKRVQTIVASEPVPVQAEPKKEKLYESFDI